jgi:hypothetical protein
MTTMVARQGRHSFIRNMMASAGVVAALTPAIARALDIPAGRRTGTIENVVFESGGQSWPMVGHVEDGKASYSDPMAGRPSPVQVTSSV